MSLLDDTLHLRPMVDYASEAVEIVRGRARDDWDRDRLLNLVLARLAEVTYEAANGRSGEAVSPKCPGDGI